MIAPEQYARGNRGFDTRIYAQHCAHPVTTWNLRQLEPKLFAKCHEANHYNRCHGGDEEKVHRNSFLCV